MSCIPLAQPAPQPAGDRQAPDCTILSLRLVEHYELVYRLPPRRGDHPQDGDELGGRSWSCYLCTGCRTEFTNWPEAVGHTIDPRSHQRPAWS